MTITLTTQEIDDIRFALIATMKQLDASMNCSGADKVLADRLELIEQRLLEG